MNEQVLRNKVLEKLLRKSATGGHKKQKDTVVNWFRSSDQGKVKDLIDEMATDPTVPLEMYGGGQRENVRLSDVGEAVRYLDANDGDVPFGLEKYLDE
jgi:hypothetical protein